MKGVLGLTPRHTIRFCFRKAKRIFKVPDEPSVLLHRKALTFYTENKSKLKIIFNKFEIYIP